MIIKVLEDRQLIIQQKENTQNENKATTIELKVPDIYSNWNKKIVFIIDNVTQWDLFTDNEYDLTKVLTKNKKINFYIWLTHEDKDFRSKTYSLEFFDNKDASDQITPEEIGAVNTILIQVDEAMTKMETINIEAEKVEDTTTIILTDRNGNEKTVNILDGEKGEKGDKGDRGIQGPQGEQGIQGPKGDNGYTPQRGIDYWTNQDKQAIESDINNDLKTYFNQPFATFEINNNGHLIMEVKEFGNT